jgi:hypothetical protein
MAFGPEDRLISLLNVSDCYDGRCSTGTDTLDGFPSAPALVQLQW